MCNVIQRAVISVFSLDFFFFFFSYRFILVCNLLAMGKALVRCCSATKIWTVSLKLWRRKKMRFPDQSESQGSKRTQIAIEPKMERMFLLPAGFAGCSLPSPPELVGKDAVCVCVCSLLVFQFSRVYLSVHCAFCSQAVPHATSSYNSSLPLLTTDSFVLLLLHLHHF